MNNSDTIELVNKIEAAVKALTPFATIGLAIKRSAKDNRWLETPLFFAGTEDDPQKWTLTGKAFNEAANALAAFNRIVGNP